MWLTYLLSVNTFIFVFGGLYLFILERKIYKNICKKPLPSILSFLHDKKIKQCIKSVNSDILKEGEKKEIDFLLILYKIYNYNWNIFVIIFVYLFFRKIAE
jgi:NADH:ubiquinone oxidoreductase subunit C